MLELIQGINEYYNNCYDVIYNGNVIGQIIEQHKRGYVNGNWRLLDEIEYTYKFADTHSYG